MGAKLLTDKHKIKRMGSAVDSLTQYEEGGDRFVDHIVTGDETRVSYVNVEQNNQWGGITPHHRKNLSNVAKRSQHKFIL